MRVVLGSGSVARRRILEEEGVAFETMPADIDERAIRHEDPAELVSLLARAKAAAILPRLPEGEPVALVTGDLVTVFDGEIREKPADEAEARRFLESYRGGTVRTVCSVCVTHSGSGRQELAVDRSAVRFGAISDEAIDALVREGGIFSAAGGFIVDSPHLEPFVEAIEEGTVEGLFGLPREALRALLASVAPESGGHRGGHV